MEQWTHLLQGINPGRRSRGGGDLLQSTHISLWEYSSHDRLTGRGVPGVSCFSLVYDFSVRPPPGNNPQVPISKETSISEDDGGPSAMGHIGRIFYRSPFLVAKAKES